MAVLEITTFRLHPAVAVSDFVQEDAHVQQAHAHLRPGIVRRTTARGDDDTWLVLTLWSDAGAADEAAAAYAQDPVTARARAMVDPSSLRTSRFIPLD